ncbi:N-acetylmuramoyl-L-alanine amidase [Sporomusa aerivorans]|uniref:N-acetylmuramoyl-L-alanine amidase family protein n=1 Tax=Sporomusa aerivorans TaxID=204936 RepID=UPI00352AF1E1
MLSFNDPVAVKTIKTIVLDPGHGASALGATSNYLMEKELNLDIALFCRDIFRQHGYDVYMTRTDDSNPGLLDRADAANILQADAFISIHNNSMPDDMPDAAKSYTAAPPHFIIPPLYSRPRNWPPSLPTNWQTLSEFRNIRSKTGPDWLC